MACAGCNGYSQNYGSNFNNRYNPSFAGVSRAGPYQLGQGEGTVAAVGGIGLVLALAALIGVPVLIYNVLKKG